MKILYKVFNYYFKDQTMKKIILLLFIAGMFSNKVNAQCDNKILWISGRQAFTNSNGDVQKEMEDKVTVEVSKTVIVFNHNDDPNDVMTGTIKDASCGWTEAFKNGKTVIKAELTEGHNDKHDAVITIEARDGNIVITLELQDKPDMKIKAFVNRYELKD